MTIYCKTCGARLARPIYCKTCGARLEQPDCPRCDEKCANCQRPRREHLTVGSRPETLCPTSTWKAP